MTQFHFLTNALKKLNHPCLPRLLVQSLLAAVLAELVQFQALGAVAVCSD